MGVKHSGCSEGFWQLFFFFSFFSKAETRVLERGGLAGKHVSECPC